MQMHHDTPRRKRLNNTQDKVILIKEGGREDRNTFDHFCCCINVGDESAGLGAVHMHRGAKL